jgi:polysaccharide chain length determinant protein (PEP-CTERM system associated)
VWPYLYRSEALILVEQQKIPEHYVTSNVILGLEERLDQMTQQMLSRTRLQQLIQQFGLYPRERMRMPLDDVIDKMRLHSRVELVPTPGKAGGTTAFRIRYSYSDPKTAQRLTNEFTSMFIEENLQARTQQSMGTTIFFEAELEQAKKDLEEQEERVRVYKLRYIGELPEQLGSNLQMLAIEESQLHASNSALDRAEQQRVYLESLRSANQALKKSLSDSPAQGGLWQSPPSSTPKGLAAALLEAKRKLTDLAMIYTPQHPDIRALKYQISQLETLVPKVEPDAPLNEGATRETPSPLQAADPGFIETESRLKALSVEIENHKKDAKRIRTQVDDLRQRLGVTPVREQQLAEVTRNYENSKANYQSLLQKKRQSELATNLEKRQKGEQFRILDSASLPKKPDEPTREEVILLGWLAGLAAGVTIAAILELLDKRIRTEADVQAFGDYPVLASIPRVLMKRDRTRRLWARIAEATVTTLLISASVGACLNTYWRT